MFAVILSVHIIICVFLIILILLQRSEGGGLGIGQAGGSGGLGDFLTARSTSNILTKTTSFLAFCFFLTSLSLVFITNSNYNQESIIDSSKFLELIYSSNILCSSNNLMPRPFPALLCLVKNGRSNCLDNFVKIAVLVGALIPTAKVSVQKSILTKPCSNNFVNFHQYLTL